MPGNARAIAEALHQCCIVYVIVRARTRFILRLLIADEETDMDVHDRALLYYRLLRRGVAHVSSQQTHEVGSIVCSRLSCLCAQAQRVVASPKEAVNLFAEDRVVEAKVGTLRASICCPSSVSHF